MRINEDLKMKRLNLHARIVVPPMATQSTEEGIPKETTLSHYENFARNPLVGLIITEHSFIDRQGKADPCQMSFADDAVIPYQAKLVEAVHTTNPDVKIFAQLNHAGFNTSPRITGQPLVSASAVRAQGDGSRELSIPEIHRLEEEFAAAAMRVKKAGYDGVEIHSAHGYLLNQFYSPLSNFRADEYGSQNMENRLRFLTETVRKIRASVGDDFPVAVRFGGCDYMDGGSSIHDAAEAAALLEKEDIDILDLSGGFNGFTRGEMSEPGWFSDMSYAVKQNTVVPVILTGGVRTPAQAEELLEEGKADLIGIGRPMMRNPAWGLN